MTLQASVLARWQSGQSIEEIATHYGVSLGLVQEWLREAVKKEISEARSRKVSY